MRKEGEMITELMRAICAVSGASKVSLTFCEHEDRDWEASAAWGEEKPGPIAIRYASHHDDPVEALRGLSHKIRNKERT